MKKRKTRFFVRTLPIAGILCLHLHSPTARADKWIFSDPVEIAGSETGVFHHVESSGRQNVTAGADGAVVVWEDNRSGTPSIYLARVSGDGVASAPVGVSGAGEAYDPVVQEFQGGHVVGWEEAGSVWLRLVTSDGLGAPFTLSDNEAGSKEGSSNGTDVCIYCPQAGGVG